MSDMIAVTGWYARFRDKNVNGESYFWTEPIICIVNDYNGLDAYIIGDNGHLVRAGNITGYVGINPSPMQVVPATTGWWCVFREKNEKNETTGGWWTSIIAWRITDNGIANVEAITTMPDGEPEEQGADCVFHYMPGREVEGAGPWPAD